MTLYPACLGSGKSPLRVTKRWEAIPGIERRCAGWPRRGICRYCCGEFQITTEGGVRVHKLATRAA